MAESSMQTSMIDCMLGLCFNILLKIFLCVASRCIALTALYRIVLYCLRVE